MMKIKKLVAFAAAAACVVGGVFAFAACGNETENATYTATYGVEDTTTYGYINGFGMCKTDVTLELKEDATFKLTKVMSLNDVNEQLEGLGGTATFSGTYEKHGGEVTLSKAETAEFSFDWTMMSYLQYAEAASEGSSADADTKDKALSLFNHWSLNTNGNSEQKLTVDAEKKTLTYVSNDVYTAPADPASVSYTLEAQSVITVKLYANNSLRANRRGFHEDLDGTWSKDGETLKIKFNGTEYTAIKNDAGKFSFEYSYGMGMAARTAVVVEK